MTVEMMLSQGKTAKLDYEDWLTVCDRPWHFDGRYAQTGHTYLHRIIAKAKKGDLVDHINGDKLDNRRSNLRITTYSINSANSKNNPRNKSGYRGVYWMKDREKWRAEICVNFRNICLGHFDDPAEGHKVYLEARHKYFGL